MFGRLRQRRELRQLIQEAANAWIAHYGDQAWDVAYSRSRDMDLLDEERALAYRLRAEIERRFGIKPRADTATRYLEPD
ncbi:MAG TPA: hypothetical protein VFB16_14675 [Bauldia sp.]|nr:hypothetical protein [Bauldia sp.]